MSSLYACADGRENGSYHGDESGQDNEDDDNFLHLSPKVIKFMLHDLVITIVIFFLKIIS